MMKGVFGVKERKRERNKALNCGREGERKIGSNREKD